MNPVQATEMPKKAGRTGQRLTWRRAMSIALLFTGDASTRRRVVSIGLVFIVWEVSARLFDNPIFFASFSASVVRGVELWQAGQLQVHVWASFIEFAVGVGASIVLGLAIGMLMASSAALQDYFDPWISMLYSMPIIALGPLFVLWFGLGLVSKIAIIFLISVFPVLINCYIGLVTTDVHLVDAARSFGASTLQTFTKVRLPAALPHIVSGIRHAIARGLIGVVVAELFGATAGLGYLILYSAQTFDTAGLFVGVLILSVSGVLAVEAVRWLERRMAPWQITSG